MAEHLLENIQLGDRLKITFHVNTPNEIIYECIIHKITPEKLYFKKMYMFCEHFGWQNENDVDLDIVEYRLINPNVISFCLKGSDKRSFITKSKLAKILD